MKMDLSLRMSTLDLHFVLEQKAVLPALVSSMWRGILGMQLKRMSEGLASCPVLPEWLPRQRLYEYFMETPPPPDAAVMRRYASVPHPYVLMSARAARDQRLLAGQPLHLRLRLFGRATALANVVILALARGAAGGIGKTRAHARLRRVLAADGSTVFVPGVSYTPPPAQMPAVPAPCPPPTRIRLESPLRLQQKGRILTPRTFSPAAFLMNIVRRYSMLCLFHEGKELQADFRELKRQAETVRLLHHRLRSVRLERYSARQGRTHPLDGLEGECVLDMSGAPDLWPFLWLGQYTLAGKGAVFGLGQYRIIAEASRSQTASR